MGDFIYIDNSNLFIEAQRLSAVQRGLARSLDDAMSNKIVDFEYHLDYGALYEFLTGNDQAQTRRLVLFGSTPPPSDTIWQIARNRGFEVLLAERNFKNKEKKIDTGLVTQMLRDGYRVGNAEEDTFVIVSGDADFVPAVQALKEEGYRVEVLGWSHATSPELRREATKFTALDPHLAVLQHKRRG